MAATNCTPVEIKSTSKLVVAGAGIILIAFALAKFRPGSTNFPTFGTYWESGNAMIHGVNPYAAYPLTYRSPLFGPDASRVVIDINLNPPCLLPLFQLMSHLNLVRFGSLWTIGSLLLLASAITLLVVHRPAMEKRQILWLLLAIPVFDTLLGGQIYFLLFFLAALV